MSSISAGASLTRSSHLSSAAAIGEGDSGDTWHATTEEWKQSRATAKDQRKDLYGY